MDSIIFSRLKSYLNRKLEIPPEQSIQVTESNLVSLLAHVCEFVEQQQQQIQLNGDEKKALALSYYKRIVLENLSADGFSKIYPVAEEAQIKHGEFVAHVQLFLEKHVAHIVDSLIAASKGRYTINVKQADSKKKGKK